MRRLNQQALVALLLGIGGALLIVVFIAIKPFFETMGAITVLQIGGMILVSGSMGIGLVWLMARMRAHLLSENALRRLERNAEIMGLVWMIVPIPIWTRVAHGWREALISLFLLLGCVVFIALIGAPFWIVGRYLEKRKRNGPSQVSR